MLILAAVGLYLVSAWLTHSAPAVSQSDADTPWVAAIMPDVVVTEFVATNDGSLVDEDGDPSDWIELYNAEDRTVSLEGWFLTDDLHDPMKWRLPAVRIPAQSFLIVFASGKDRARSMSELHTNFCLNAEGESLALIAPDGQTVVSTFPAPYVQQYAGVAYGLDAERHSRYFQVPTPGEANVLHAANRGPIVLDVGHAPHQPAAGEPLVVTATVRSGPTPISTVSLHYRVMFGTTVTVRMRDDGHHGDGAPGDGRYGATIPAEAYAPGDMVRYYVTGYDAEGLEGRWPLFPDPDNSPQYLGTVVADPELDSNLPILHWFVEEPAAAEEREGTRASVFYAGHFYDNVFVRLRGYTSVGWPKVSLKFDFNQGHPFHIVSETPDVEEYLVEEFNLNSNYSDKSYVRELLAWETFQIAGGPYAIAFPMRVQQNGEFYAVSNFVEQVDERYLTRQGMDPEGALYKMLNANTLNSATEAVAKRTRRDEDHSDLQALIDGLNLEGEARQRFIFDNVDLPSVLNYLAATAVLHDIDQGHNNYYVYRDTRGTGAWTILPWDKDLVFGHHIRDGELTDRFIVDDDPISHPLHYYTTNLLITAVADRVPVFKEMYLRRLRTLMDEVLQPPGTPVPYYEQRMDALASQLLPDAALDAERWPRTWGEPMTLTQAVRRIEDDYLAPRRQHLYVTHGPEGTGLIPPPQPADVAVAFGKVAFVPPLYDEDEEYFTLVNPNPFAVDLSGWTIGPGLDLTLRPGVVIPAGGTLYFSPNVPAFRARAQSPTGGEGHFVQSYEGHLTDTGGALELYTPQGTLVARTTF